MLLAGVVNFEPYLKLPICETGVVFCNWLQEKRAMLNQRRMQKVGDAVRWASKSVWAGIIHITSCFSFGF